MKHFFTSFFCLQGKGLSNDDIEVARETLLEEYMAGIIGAGFKPGDFVKERFGGATEGGLTTKTFSQGISGATSSGSPSHIRAASFRIAGSTLSWITEASAVIIEVAGSSSPGTAGPPDHQLIQHIQGSTD